MKSGKSRVIIIFAIVTAVIWTATIIFNSLYTETFYQFLKQKSGFTNQIDSKYLWRPLKSAPTDDRIMAQLEWSKNFARDKNFEELKPKKILLFAAEISYWATGCKVKCPGFEFNKCQLTKSTELKDPWERLGDYDAIVFTQSIVKEVEVEIPSKSKQIIYILESPYLARANLTMNNAILSSYYKGSDIQIPYNKWVPYYTEKGTLQADMLAAATVLNMENLNFASSKTHFAVIVVSNCEEKTVQNDRMKYLNELKRFVPVDVFGKCGIVACKKGDKECTRTLIKKYKFYLAFENANCRDYITEKLFTNALKNDVIPIVLGAHPDDYKAAAPPHSYIHVEDFDSPEVLANYLKVLDKNDTLYNEYFRWKSEGYFYNALSDYFCRVCAMLFYADIVPQPTWSINSTWESVNTCLPRGQWYWENKI